MTTKQTLLVFDLDGTLLDSEDQHQMAYIEACHDLGIEEINTDWHAYLHLTDSYVFKVNFENAQEKKYSPTLLEEFEQRFLFHIKNKNAVKEIKGAISFLHAISKQNNYKVAFATGSLKLPALYKLKQAGFEIDEEVLFASNHFFEREQIVKAAIVKAKLKNKINYFDRIISFGDGLWDFKTANNLSLEFIGIGKEQKKLLKENGVENHFDDFENDLDRFKNLLNIV